MIVSSVKELIGNTPLLEIDPKVHGLTNIRLYAKLEMLNPFGSIKDRTALGLLEHDLKRLQEEKRTVIEASSGNTAKALQILSSMDDLSFLSVTNRMRTPEPKQVLSILGGKIEELPGLSLCPDPSDPSNPISVIKSRVESSPNEYFHTSQYNNERNVQKHYETTGKEIIQDLGYVDYFITTLGTTGSSRGIYNRLREVNPDVQMIGVVASKSDYIPGIRNQNEMKEVGLYQRALYHEILEVDSLSAIQKMQVLNQKLGVLGGPTSGACLEGALTFLKEVDAKLESERTAVFIVCDRMEWYTSYITERMPLFHIRTESQMVREVIGNPEYEISLANIDSFIEQKKPLIVDMRSILSYKHNHIPGSIHIFEESLLEQLSKGISFPDDIPILFVCPLGEKSLKLATYLQEKGLHTFSLKGGMQLWKQQTLMCTT